MTIAASTLRQIPRGVWVLGFVSLFMDISSEMIHSLLPLKGSVEVKFLEGPTETQAALSRR